jgi:protein-S-isoprenylcysteine O-methyltransferase Ste14
MSLNSEAWLRLVGLTLVMGLLVFVPAGSLRFWQAWVYLAVFFEASALVTLDLMKRDPALLRRRVRGGPTAETQPTQRLIMSFLLLGFVSLLVVPGLDHRFAWSVAPVWAVAAGDVLMALGFYVIFLVYRENTFTSATVEVSEGQRVASTGPYAIVRHPMYAGGLLFLLGTPPALGSWWGLVGLGVMLPFLTWRIVDEERLLARDLAGYREYQRRVRRRLVPGVW